VYPLIDVGTQPVHRVSMGRCHRLALAFHLDIDWPGLISATVTRGPLISCSVTLCIVVPPTLTTVIQRTWYQRLSQVDPFCPK